MDKSKQIEETVNSIVGPPGFWKDATFEVYHNAVIKLVALGMTHEETISLLTKLYWAAASEYGD